MAAIYEVVSIEEPRCQIEGVMLSKMFDLFFSQG